VSTGFRFKGQLYHLLASFMHPTGPFSTRIPSLTAAAYERAGPFPLTDYQTNVGAPKASLTRRRVVKMTVGAKNFDKQCLNLSLPANWALQYNISVSAAPLLRQ
jgi:hypothetical protein